MGSESGGANDIETVLADLHAFEAPELGLMLAPAPHGELLIIGVRPASAAERAGLRRGDFIMKIDGQEVPSIETLKAAIHTGPRRESAKVLAWRGGKQTEREILLSPAARTTGLKRRPWAGIQCDEVPGKGLVIKAVYPGGPAAQAGLNVGDVIVSADGVKIDSLVDAEKYMAQLQPFAEAAVVVLRNGEELAMRVKTISLRETPEGLVLEDDATDSDASTQGETADGGEAVELERWEAEQHQRLELLLQEIRQDIKELKTKIEPPKKDE
jgi:S1-C subfamily serine protease